MSRKKDSMQMGFDQTLFAEDSPARTSQLQETKKAYMRKEADYGQSALVCLGRFDLNTQSLKTSQRCLVATEGDGFSEFYLTFPRSGIMQNGIVYQLQTLDSLTKETESGLLPTPTKHNSKDGAYPSEYKRNTPSLATHAGGKINPEWSEWLMGFPHKHTDLDA